MERPRGECFPRIHQKLECSSPFTGKGMLRFGAASLPLHLPEASSFPTRGLILMAVTMLLMGFVFAAWSLSVSKGALSAKVILREKRLLL
jgi:hypothetical protein